MEPKDGTHPDFTILSSTINLKSKMLFIELVSYVFSVENRYLCEVLISGLNSPTLIQNVEIEGILLQWRSD
jgi:hypothetical protein